MHQQVAVAKPLRSLNRQQKFPFPNHSRNRESLGRHWPYLGCHWLRQCSELNLHPHLHWQSQWHPMRNSFQFHCWLLRHRCWLAQLCDLPFHLHWQSQWHPFRRRSAQTYSPENSRPASALSQTGTPPRARNRQTNSRAKCSPIAPSIGTQQGIWLAIAPYQDRLQRA